MNNLRITFLPSDKVDTFLNKETSKAKLRYAVRVISERNGDLEYNLDSLEYHLGDDDIITPWACIFGLNEPLLTDCRMLVEYLNSIEPNTYYIKERHGCMIEICRTPVKLRLWK